MSLEHAMVNKQYSIVDLYLKKNVKLNNPKKTLKKYLRSMDDKLFDYFNREFYMTYDNVEPIILIACYLNDTYLVKLVLSYKGLPDENVVEFLFHIAYNYKNYDIISCLISDDTKINIMDLFLEKSKERLNDKNLIRLFLHNENYRTQILPLVAYNEELSIEIIKLGVAHFDELDYILNENVLKCILNKYNVKQACLNKWIFRSVLNNDYNLTKLLIENNANVGDLFTLCIHNNLDKAIKCFTQDKNLLNNRLIYASKSNFIDEAKLLIDNGADVNCKDQYNNTPLIAASEKNNYKIVKLLIDNGAIDYNNMAKLLATQNKCGDVIKLLY